MWDSIRRQGGAVLHPDAAPIPPEAGTDVPSQNEIQKTVVPTGHGSGTMGSGFGWW